MEKLKHTKANIVKVLNYYIDITMQSYHDYKDDEKEYKHLCLAERSAYRDAIKLIQDKEAFDRAVALMNAEQK